MSNIIKQSDAIEQVLDKIHQTFLKAMETGSGLQGVKSVIDGDSLHYTPQTPALWVMPSEASCEHDRGAIRETWTLPVTIVGVVAMTRPEHHRRQAIDIVSEAMSLIVKNRRLGLSFVHDVVKTGLAFRPARSPDRSKGLYAVAGTVKITLNIREV